MLLCRVLVDGNFHWESIVIIGSSKSLCIALENSPESQVLMRGGQCSTWADAILRNLVIVAFCVTKKNSCLVAFSVPRLCSYNGLLA